MTNAALVDDIEIALLDVLPGRGGAALETGLESDGWQRQAFALDAAAGQALRDWMPRQPQPPSMLLLAALALVESRLTGATRVRATLFGSQGASQATIEVPRQGGWAAWLATLPQDLRGGAAHDEPVAWAVLPDDAAAMVGEAHPGIQTASTWRLLTAGELGIEVAFRAPLAAEAVALLVTALQTVLMAAAEDASLAAIDLLDPAQRTRQLLEWNDTAVSRAPGDTVHGRFDSVRETSLDAIAVIDAASSMTYAELGRAADNLASRLRAAGVRPGEIVAVAMERSVAAIVAVLAVLKAGAAYLPLELAHPAERLAFVLEDARVRVVVVDDAGAGLALPAAMVRVGAVGVVTPAAPARPAANADATDTGGTDADTDFDTDTNPDAESDFDGDGDALAYVMYTSGSTGTPKGVEIQHHAVLRLVCGVDYVALGPDTRMLHAAPLGFDASTLEVWGALLNGGRVVVHDEAIPSGAGLAATIRRHDVTTAWLTATLFNAIVDEDVTHLAGLRELFTGGEALSVEHVRRMRRAAPQVRLCNGYGPTECTTFTCTHQIPADIAYDVASIPIGRPIADTQVFVLNTRLEPMPVGVVGELYVGGAGLARGYLNRPELTAQRFVPNPFGPPGTRLYRTGDQVRFRPDGSIDFVGRADTQVKIRGFRIELAEIEAVLARHPAVRSCSVLARADQPGDKRLVAYFVAEGAAAPVPALRAHLAAALPEFMVPARYVRLDALPLTANGKLDRGALPAPDDHRPELACAYQPPASATERRVCDAFSSLLGIDGVGRDDNFFELGGDSLLAMRLRERLRVAAAAGEEGASADGGQAARTTGLAATLVFRNPTPAMLAAVLDGTVGEAIDPARMARVRSAGDEGGHHDPIAIIAMAGRFPGAADVEAFWQNLCDGRDSITVFRDDQLDPAVSAADRADPAYVAARGVIDGVEDFDAAFFGIGPREAELMDPQQRIFLELCWQCLERGGHVPDATPGPVGVFAGMYNASYYQRHVIAHPELIDTIGEFQVMLGNEKDYIATRVAHKLNLTGPAISVHTGCSTSLVAICQAVNALRHGQCDMALAGGVSVTCPPRSGYRYQEGAMLSPDGHTRTFDARAQGTVFSDGAAVVLLKRLSDARADGNPVYAVIRGCAVNNDGGNKASFTAPSSDGQAAVIAMAHDDAGVDPRSISYVEAHGTATPLGDPIEIEALGKAFRRGTADTGFCRIGSVKSNVGHTVIAAGATGLIKTALALAQCRIPASVHFEQANPVIDFAGSPFVVNARMSDWPASAAPRRAGVSAFGVGGTNAHVILEEAPAVPDSDPPCGVSLLVLSARTPAALQRAAEDLADHLDAHPACNLADVAWTLAIGRKAFGHRLAVVAESAGDAAAQLRGAATAAATARSRPSRRCDVVFLFPGQGAQYAGMGRGLYEAEPAFRAAFDECADTLRGELGFDLRDRVFGDDPDALLPTSTMQPATFAIEYSLARLWMSHGIVPAAMLGHSVGEFVAATLAGVFSLPDALRLVARRGALMQAQPPGAMLSVRLGLDALLSRLPGGVSLAAENAPGACVVAGPQEAVAAFQLQLEAEGVACRALRTSHAFHSSMMDPVVAPFLAEVAAIARSAPRLPLVSTATGEWLDAATATSPEYWARHLREPVRFATALARVVDTPARVLLEVGPRATLGTLSRQHPGVREHEVAVVASLADTPVSETADFHGAAGQLWCGGVEIDPGALDRRAVRHRVRLPTYPFEGRLYWIEAALPAGGAAPRADAAPDPATPVTAVAMAADVAPAAARKPRLVRQLREVFEDVAGFDLDDADADANFLELGLDSLMLTQVALQLQKTFAVGITFRQLMCEGGSLDRLAALLDQQLPDDALASVPAAPVPTPAAAVATVAMPALHSSPGATAMPCEALAGAAGGDALRTLIVQQMQLMAQQLALLTAAPVGAVAPSVALAAIAAPAAAVPAQAMAASQHTRGEIASPADRSPESATDVEEAALAHTRYDVAKAFGAIARIHNAHTDLTGLQRARLDAFTRRYVDRTRGSKEYTQQHRPHLADPRVVNGFRPLLKEITYQIVVDRSKGSRVWDIDGNEYIDVLNGFGMNLFGWQPDFVLEAVRRQLDQGYEIGPQHPLAGEVANLVCEVTGFDRAGLCNTGSEAVMGTIRIARTVTGRSTLVIFTGSYHGIFDEVLVRGTKKLRSVPAAPGILRNTAENVLVLDYGSEESLAIIRERAGEIAAVLVEPVQSRRPDFQPREFLQQVRAITRDAGALLIFDEVVTGFRAHPRGAQHVLGVDADLASYGKVVGGGFPIGVIAGKRQYMDALDGGHWQFGDDSIPTVGVTYFAGTFVRHPLALAAAKAVLEHIQAEGPALQERLNASTAAMAAELNAFCDQVGAPIAVKHFASVWKTVFTEDHPLQDLLFAMMRSRGIHVLDNFPCFFTTAHSAADFSTIVDAFKESVLELQAAAFLPRRLDAVRLAFDPSRPPLPGARLGRDPDGNPAWFVANPDAPDQYLKVNA